MCCLSRYIYVYVPDWPTVPRSYIAQYTESAEYDRLLFEQFPYTIHTHTNVHVIHTVVCVLCTVLKVFFLLPFLLTLSSHISAMQTSRSSFFSTLFFSLWLSDCDSWEIERHSWKKKWDYFKFKVGATVSWWHFGTWCMDHFVVILKFLMLMGLNEFSKLYIWMRLEMAEPSTWT